MGDTDHLKAFSAAVASSGEIASFIWWGLLRGPDLKRALQGQTPEETMVLTDDMLGEAKEKLCCIRKPGGWGGNRLPSCYA